MASLCQFTKKSEELHRDSRWAVIERIAASQHLKTSLRLQELLFYIAECAIRDAPGDVTEQQIGIHVFKRSPGYNSSEDSIVRTHARLLRQKLTAYFAEDGTHEEIVVEVPKGHYLPVSRTRSDGDAGHTVRTEEVPVARVPLEDRPLAAGPVAAGRSSLWVITAASIVLLMLVALASWHPWKQRYVAQSPIDVFWRPFFVDDPPFVIFSNALFTGNSTTGLKYASPGSVSDGNATTSYVDTYTGIGELASVYDLTKLFDEHKASFTLKRSQLVAWDEAQSRNLVFIGASVENPSLRVLQPTVDFTPEAHEDYAGIVNHRPRPGEPAMYSRPEHPLTMDCAIIALLPGVQPGKRVLLFSGLTTFGMQAAVEFLCRPDSVAEILKQVTGPRGEICPFEAVVQIDMYQHGAKQQVGSCGLRVHVILRCKCLARIVIATGVEIAEAEHVVGIGIGHPGTNLLQIRNRRGRLPQTVQGKSLHLF